MLKIVAAIVFVCAFLLIPTSIKEPDTTQLMAFRAARYRALHILHDQQVAAIAKAQAEAEAAHKRKAINNLVTYLERKWRVSALDGRRIINTTLDLTSRPSSPSEKPWPQPLDVLAIMQVESGFDPKARDSQSGSVGLMQINIDARDLTAEELEQPAKNIAWGIRLLRKYRSEMRSEAQALVAYNQGPVSAALTCGRQLQCSTRYTEKVALAKEELQRHFR